MEQAVAVIHSGNFETAQIFVSEIFHGEEPQKSKDTDPGMEGSLLYHMAMVTKMETEPKIVLEALRLNELDVTVCMLSFFDAFVLDVKELTKKIEIEISSNPALYKAALNEEEKIALFEKLSEKTKTVEAMLKKEDFNAELVLLSVFLEWVANVIGMRVRQEYETIKGFLILTDLTSNLGIEHISKVMDSVQEKFGKATAAAALNVTLKTGMSRQKLQAIMQSDHYIEFRMSEIEGYMRFLNCPIFGSHHYILDILKAEAGTAELFCRYFCVAHAKAMFETVLPFTFEMSQPKLMSSDGQCEFHLKLAQPSNETKARFIPLVVSWNVAAKCNLKCAHCYINAGERKDIDELSTDGAKLLMHQIAEVSKPLLILSGGEPLLRQDIFELIRYGAERGLKMAMGSNGMLIDDVVAGKLKDAGITTVSISLDSSMSALHDQFRGVTGSWQRAVEAIKALKRSGVIVQVNTTVTQQNYSQIGDIFALAEKLGAENFHLFFLVPTGRGAKIEDITPNMYEKMITSAFSKSAHYNLNVKPSCAPQFMHIARETGIDMTRWVRGCMAGLYYCRIYPNGEVTPCPYLPIALGNIRQKSFKDIWFNSEVLRNLRDFKKLKGKCGKCEFNAVCGGCRARAYGLTSDFIDFCGDLHEPTELRGDYLAEEPWCTYKPKVRASNATQTRV